MLHAVLRKTIPPPGKIEEFKARNKMRDYHAYYLQFISLFHAFMGCIFDPLILYWGGYRYNQPNHLLHNFMLAHSFAYFLADSILEIAYGTDDMLMNCHHVAVLFVSYFNIRAPHSGFEYLLVHFFAELSNPFLICRTVLRILGKKDTMLYKVNDIIFATVFILIRVFLTPVVLVYILEGHNVLYSLKLGTIAVFFVQLFWAYRIIYLILEMIRDPYVKKEKTPPVLLEMAFQIMHKVEKDKKFRMGVSITNFIVIFVVPHIYYGMIVGNLKVNLVF